MDVRGQITGVDTDRPVYWNDEKLYAAWSRVPGDERALVLVLADPSDGEIPGTEGRPAATAVYGPNELFEVVSSPGVKGVAVPDGDYVVIRMYSECEGALDALVTAGIIDQDYTVYPVPGGFKEQFVAVCLYVVNV